MDAINPREIIAMAIRNAGRANSYNKALFVIGDLEAAGFDLIHRDENHGPTLERAAGIADGAAAEFDRLIEDGKGEHGKPGYVTDAVWHSWYGKLSALNSIASALRAMGGEAPWLS